MSKCSAFYIGLETKGNKDEKTVPIAIFNILASEQVPQRYGAF